MNILTFDPGLTTLGWAYLTAEDDVVTVVETGTILATKHTSRVKYRTRNELYGKRLISLEYINNAVEELILSKDVDIIAIEAAFFNPKRPNAYHALVQVIHTISWVAYHSHKLKTYEVPTKIAKMHISSGDSKKVDISKGIHLQEDLIITRGLILNEHIADAIAVGYGLIKNNFNVETKKKKTKHKKRK